MREIEPCSAPIHEPKCNGLGETRDHFTPKSVAKLMGWSRKQMNSPENIQHLSKACHAEKDKVTPILREVNRRTGGAVDREFVIWEAQGKLIPNPFLAGDIIALNQEK